MEPGKPYRIEVPLNAVAYSFPAGHRIRVSLSTTYWPMIWPSAHPVGLKLWSHRSSFTLPLRPERTADRDLQSFPAPEVAALDAHVVLRPARGKRTVERDLGTGEYTSTVFDDYGHVRLEDSGIEISSIRSTQYRILENDPLTAHMESRWVIEIGRGDWRTKTVTRTSMTATTGHFALAADVDAFEGENEHAVFNRHWDATVPRNLV
jgi:uncharacterized protein